MKRLNQKNSIKYNRTGNERTDYKKFQTLQKFISTPNSMSTSQAEQKKKCPAKEDVFCKNGFSVV